MPVTAADVHNVNFHRPPMGRRGYDAAQVDAFFDDVEREMVRLIEENNDLRSQVERGGHGGTPPAPAADPRLTAELAGVKEQLDQVERDKVAAEQAARAVQAELEQMRPQDARHMGGARGQQALRVLTVAQRTADDHVADAHREADRLLSDARSTAAEVTSDAQAAATALDRDARQRHQEAMTSIDAQRTELQAHIEELKDFERAYRTRLRAYLEGQLRELAGRGSETQTNRGSSTPSEGSPDA